MNSLSVCLSQFFRKTHRAVKLRQERHFISSNTETAFGDISQAVCNLANKSLNKFCGISLKMYCIYVGVYSLD